MNNINSLARQWIRTDENNVPLEFPFNPLNLKKLHVNMSFPDRFDQDPEFLSAFNIRPVYLENPPVGQIDMHTQRAVMLAPEWTIDSETGQGYWLRRHIIEDFPDDQLDRNLRTKRDSKLKHSDWTQTMDSPFSAEVKDAWKQYRQALRDLPQQPGWPRSVQWPQEPPNS